MFVVLQNFHSLPFEIIVRLTNTQFTNIHPSNCSPTFITAVSHESRGTAFLTEPCLSVAWTPVVTVGAVESTLGAKLAIGAG